MELLCQWIKTLATDLFRRDRQIKKCCVSEGMDRMEDVKELVRFFLGMYSLRKLQIL
jgi:hypothetical protein